MSTLLDLEESPDEEQEGLEVQSVELENYFYVCSECGYGLTEIPNYNRYYCENCGLHY
jgi:predicted SprT family Zn-dependent metalloprotease